MNVFTAENFNALKVFFRKTKLLMEYVQIFLCNLTLVGNQLGHTHTHTVTVTFQQLPG